MASDVDEVFFDIVFKKPLSSFVSLSEGLKLIRSFIKAKHKSKCRSESLSKIIEQLEILFLSETKRVLMAKSSNVVLEVFSVTGISETCVH